ncbi:endonuclease NucS domain-containing protein [Asticcacaulis sp. YBE204]|uniref:endonuclease NucS domain-containing protein n=1 Tax=Asticcacaulis sp. YBE204 TaxID=1282363 RepID=UPI0009DFEC04|nr:endonuclease NucS domain-containing protein [Asticcacaulis sp. YBE204]
MQEKLYKMWLQAQSYDSGTVTAQLHRSQRVEKYHGDLDQHFKHDRLETVISLLTYSAEDARRGRANPSKIPLDAQANIRNNLASYKDAIRRYARFLDTKTSDPSFAGHEIIPENDPVSTAILHQVEDVEGQRIGLERDMQSALRKHITSLEEGLVLIDDGVERIVESGRIDITARDQNGITVVIELKAGPAGPNAVAQILSYMGDISSEEEGQVRGILVASEFTGKAKSAAKMVPHLSLTTYKVKFLFNSV